MPPVIKGTVVAILPEGYGFIKRIGGDVDYFFDRRALVGVTFEELREGQSVIFQEADGSKGPKARHVMVDVR